jgi:hypothetical protein
MINKFSLGIGAVAAGALVWGVVWARSAETVKGTVTDVFGHRFVIQGDTGKTLVDIGPKGLELVTVKVGDQVTVDGERKPTEIKAERVAVGPSAPVEIRAGKKDELAMVKGTVTDVFGHRFVIQGDTGKTLVDIGPKGLELVTVKVGDQVTVDGERKPTEIKAERVAVGPSAPVEIRAGKKDELATLKGTVTDVFGHRFVIQGDTGKTLVDIGPKALQLVTVKIGNQVTVEGEKKHTEFKAKRVTVGTGTPVEIGRGKKDDD